MNEPRSTEFESAEFESALQRCIDPIAAGAGRKRLMREEMLAHLLSSYEQELRRQPDEGAAAEAAIRRMGAPDDLRRQLQATVPGPEHLFFLIANRKETGMLFPIIGVVLWICGAISNHEQVEAGGVVLLWASVFWQMLQRESVVLRRLGPRSPWLVGLVAIAFGPAMILPALAKIKNDAGATVLAVEFLAVGVLITVGGLVLVGSKVWPGRRRIA
jgi:hypothetical protein